MKKNKEYFIYSAITIIVAVFSVVGIIYAWTEPKAAPPNGNVPAPINTGDESQYKTGRMGAYTSGIDSNYGFTVGSKGIKVDGDSWFDGKINATNKICDSTGCIGDNGSLWSKSGSKIYYNSGKVGIGIDDPGYTLTVGGDLDMRGNKIRNVKEIDPIFSIQGKKYTSYSPDMIHQKIEVVGEGTLQGDRLVIDLNEQTEGSDLWLFWQTVARETIMPFVSSQSDAELYSYIDGSKFIIKLRDGEQNAKFSYRLIGTRLDHIDDINNLYDNQTVEYFIDIDKLRK